MSSNLEWVRHVGRFDQKCRYIVGMIQYLPRKWVTRLEKCLESTRLIGRLVLTKYAPYAIIPVQMLRETCDNRNEARAGLKVVANS